MKKIVRAALTLLFCLLLFGFQSAFGMRLRFFGAGFDLLPMAAVTAGVLSGAAVGGWTGFALGLMADMNRPGGICLYAGLYFLLGALAGQLTKLYLRRSLLTAFLGSLAALALLHLGSFALSAFVYGGTFAGYWREFLLTLVFSALLYFLVYPPLTLLDRLGTHSRREADMPPPRRIRTLGHHRRTRT